MYCRYSRRHEKAASRPRLSSTREKRTFMVKNAVIRKFPGDRKSPQNPWMLKSAGLRTDSMPKEEKLAAVVAESPEMIRKISQFNNSPRRDAVRAQKPISQRSERCW